MRMIFFTTVERCFCKRKIGFSFYLSINTQAAFLHPKRYLALLTRSIFLCSTSGFSENLQFLKVHRNKLPFAVILSPGSLGQY